MRNGAYVDGGTYDESNSGLNRGMSPSFPWHVS